MRSALFLCALVLAATGPAAAQSAKKKTLAVPPPAAAAATPAAPVLASPPLDPRAPILPPVGAALASPVGGPALQCRKACAQTYYFCLSDGRSEDCSGNWGQCRAGCGAADRAGY